MKMMPGGPKLCSHHRLAGPSLELREGDHTIEGWAGAIDTATRHICAYVYTDGATSQNLQLSVPNNIASSTNYDHLNAHVQHML